MRGKILVCTKRKLKHVADELFVDRLMNIPGEVLTNILIELPLHEVLRFGQVCKNAYELIWKSDKFWRHASFYVKGSAFDFNLMEESLAKADYKFYSKKLYAFHKCYENYFTYMQKAPPVCIHFVKPSKHFGILMKVGRDRITYNWNVQVSLSGDKLQIGCQLHDCKYTLYLDPSTYFVARFDQDEKKLTIPGRQASFLAALGGIGTLTVTENNSVDVNILR
jgi:hypothetical protein